MIASLNQAPAISVVIPVYNVEAYVRSCIDSILREHDIDLEVLVIEDCSTDGSLSVVRDVAAGDDRVQVIELSENDGLGNARNVGLDHARGEWVLFLDSDDEITAGSIRAMLDLGERTDADLVMFDYARLYWDQERKRNMNAALFKNGEGPTTLSERPELLDNLNVAWNKLYRRSFITETELRFPPGIYEDLPWTYPMLLEARRIALLDRVALLYRQRREGSILRSASRNHVDVFDQYERLFDWLDTQPQHAWARDALHKKMVAHLFTVFDHGDRRLPRDLRGHYYHRMSHMVTHHAPDDYTPTGKLGGFRRRALLSDRYWLELIFGRGQRSRRKFKKMRRTAKRFLQEQKGRLGTAVRIAYYHLQRRRRVDKNLAIFAAYWYAQYSGNPKAISDAAARLAPAYRRVWLIDKESQGLVPDSEEVVIVGTWAYYRALATASILVDNSNLPNFVKHRKGSTYLQTHHGTPLKSMGLDLMDRKLSGNMDFAKLMERVDRWDFILSSNRYSTEIWSRVLPSRFRTLEYGYPRNDVFFGDVAEAGQQVRRELGINPDATVILYAPTFRDHRLLPTLDVDLVSLSAALPDNTTFLVRAHYLDEDYALQSEDIGPNIRDVSGYPDVQRLCLAADALVTDYSSIMFDYANLDRPIVIYAPDWDTYRNVRGVYFDLLAEAPGPVVTTQDQLEKVLQGGVSKNDLRPERSAFRRKYCEFDDGHAADRVVRRLFLNEELADRFDDLQPEGRGQQV